MFESYNEKARRAIFFARYECSQYGSANIESEHLLLGILREVKLLGVTPDVVRREIEEQIVSRPRTPTSVEAPLSTECCRVLEFAAEETKQLGQTTIQPEHLALGLLREERCLGARVLRAHRVTPEQIHAAMTSPDAAKSAAARATHCRGPPTAEKPCW